MTPINQLDEADLRYEMRKMYQEVGFAGSLQVLYELITSAAIMAEVIAEERMNLKKVENEDEE